jgi:uncharacterized membrane protein YqhA
MAVTSALQTYLNSSMTFKRRDNMTRLFNSIFSLRYLAILAIVFPFFGAALMYLFGALNTVEAYLLFFGLQETEGAVDSGEAAMIELVASIDHFLFATILVVFSNGLYALFFRTSSSGGEGETQAKRPSWKQIKNLGGMDETLLKVIIMLLAVAFLEFMLNAGMGTLDWTVLVVPITIIALAIGLKWMSSASEEETKKDEAELKIDKLGELEKLATLWKEGAINDTEYEQAKEKMLRA